MKTIRNNEKLMAEIGRIAEVAGYLWTKDGQSVTVVTFP